LTTLSYLSAILPHLITSRKYVRPGPVCIIHAIELSSQA
jgi:hypothetical protein